MCEYVCVYVCESLKLCKCSQVENIKVITYSLCLCVAPLYSLVFTCLKILSILLLRYLLKFCLLDIQVWRVCIFSLFLVL